MNIIRRPIDWYVDRLRLGRPFSVAGYSDAEWHCVLGQRDGEKTALGQVLSKEHGLLLRDVLKRRSHSSRFLFAVPECLRTMPGFDDGRIDWHLGKEGIAIEAVERDMVTDDLARRAGLFPFIDQLRRMDTVLIGPSHLSQIDFLGHAHHVEISTPNLHMEPGGIDRAVKAALAFGKPAVYLVSAGVSAAVIIDRLHDRIGGSWFIDCGSIWDAFVGAGGQRDWRAALYADPARWQRWKGRNLTGGSSAGVRGYRRDELAQDRAADLLDTFDRYGYGMFEQQRAIYQNIAREVEVMTALEAGCGNGLGTAILERMADRITGTDKSERNVAFARCLYPWIDFQAWDLNHPTDLRAEAVVCVEAVEHVRDARAALENLLAAAEVEVWISTPNGQDERPPENPYHVAEYSPGEMVRMALECGAAGVTIYHYETMEVLGVDTKVTPLLYRIEK